MTIRHSAFLPGDQVRSERFGLGQVEVDKERTAIVRFRHGLEECEKSTLQQVLSPRQAIDLPEWHAPLDVITRAQAEAILSVNDTWGIFSRSRIALLPHQLWVCRRVLAQWPTRWLVADDVGLGKTIEAGLILWPLLARGTVKRLLILCPASLVEQWQWRMREMFDIRLTRYTPDADTPRSDFWNTHHQVVASLQTLRANTGGRQDRLRESDPWDMLIVDEAHHLNHDEQAGPTLGYQLVERLVDERRVTSVVFFTGTPHRGKDYGFWALLRLLRPDRFDPRRPSREQLPHLRQVMIRNNKQDVTDLKGERLFQRPEVSWETYRYSPAEARFYAMLTEFILTGKAYASSLSGFQGRAVILVLIALQKLASSSVAAIRRAIRRRLERLAAAKDHLRSRRPADVSASLVAEYLELEATGEADELSRREENLAERLVVSLMDDEEARLRELLAAADVVGEETKVARILSLLETRFAGRSVLLFTEYKATQSLVMSALIRRFGEGCVAFINGDDRAEDVYDASGHTRTFHDTKEGAAEKFNAGVVRFLVSTEAGGEGIDLHERCHSLINVDLPWNPMRLHQRVGRLNRYGQRHRVEGINLHNPDTVESLIWSKLNEKIASIMLALSRAMDEPEDLLQLVLGMTSPSLFRDIFSEAPAVPRESLADWFDQKTARFGGRDVLETVQELVGHANRFDFAQVSSDLPQLDLPALAPFLKAMLALNGRQVREEHGTLAFRTPEAWMKEPGIRPDYRGLTFDRQDRSSHAAQRVLGVGHKVVDQALAQARAGVACVATVPPQALKRPLILWTVTDSLTTEGGVVRQAVVGVEWSAQEGEHPRMLRDWEALLRLNEVLEGRGFRRLRSSVPPADIPAVQAALDEAQRFLERRMPELRLPFRIPIVAPLAVLWPARSGQGPAGFPEPDEEDDVSP